MNKLKEAVEDVSMEVDELTDRVHIIHSTFTKLWVAFQSVLFKMHYMGIVFNPLPVVCLRFVL